MSENEKNALVPTTSHALIKLSQETSAPVVADCTGGNFLPQLRMTAPMTKQVKAGEVKPNQFVIFVDGKIEEVFGDSVDVFICGVRNRASCKIDGETYVSFDPESAFYAQCLADSENKVKEKDPLAGRELLVYIPDSEDYQFATFLFGNPSMRNTSKRRFKGIVGKFATCFPDPVKAKSGHEYETPGFKFHKDKMSADDLPFAELELAMAKFDDKKDKLPEEDDDEQDDR